MKLYIYDHCPYCTKARMIFGYTNTALELITLDNDDEKTPISLVGQKIVPILELSKDQVMPESLDIIDKVNELSGNKALDKTIPDEELISWLQESRNYVYKIAMPRWVKADLEEFRTQKAIDYFTKKKEDYIGSFEAHLKNSETLFNMAHEHLNVLENFISRYIDTKKPTLSYINLYASLRCLTIAKEITFPEEVLKFMKQQESLSKVSFHKPI